MKIVKNPEEITRVASDLRAGGCGLALVPTMGALHQGHLSLVGLALEGGRRTVVSVFVNPTQFGPGEDFARYPRDLEKDAALLEKEGADVLFAPDAQGIYPEGFSTRISLPSFENVLCGPFRPGHFGGVATVCCVLFGIVRPDVAVFGRKDAQQLAVIRRMVADLRLGIGIVAAPIVREPDGLAMSSRNAYLTPDQRKEAPAIFRGISAAAALARLGAPSAVELRAAFEDEIGPGGILSIQYADLVDPSTMVPMDRLDRDGLFAVAVHAGKTRLIDNAVLRPGVGAVEV
ncbi:MAG TPA: pantoate--beta-alanine ligase [Candidatus Fermentibacter daniensis]|nr:pantoate--beta-alanine ligase [Candidatus Fermentibacter daniensis]